MQVSEIKKVLCASGLPTAYRFFRGKHELPYVVWYIGGETNFAADGENYFNIKQLTVELYTQVKDPQAEAAVEAVLPGIWTKTEEYIDGEKCYQIVYNLEV